METKKMCSFYISNFHLLTILLPYINTKIENKETVELLLQSNLNLSVNEYLNNVDIDGIDKNVIRKISWNEHNNIEKNKCVNNIIIVGNEDFIISKSKEIEEQNINYKEIVNFYNFNEVKKIEDCNKKYNYILSTKGIVAI